MRTSIHGTHYYLAECGSCGRESTDRLLALIWSCSSVQEIDEFRTHLLRYKHKMHAPVWSSGPLLSGEMKSSAGTDFYMDGVRTIAFVFRIIA